MDVGIRLWHLHVMLIVVSRDVSSRMFMYLGFQILWKHYPLVNWYAGRAVVDYEERQQEQLRRIRESLKGDEQHGKER